MLLGNQSLVNDPYYNDVVLLLRGYDATSGQAFKDYSKYNLTISVFGNTSHSTTQKKYGNSSIYFNGNGDYLTIPSSSNFGFGTGDFTIEFWAYRNSMTDLETLFELGLWNNGILLRLRSSGEVPFIYINGVGHIFPINTYFVTGIWSHIALVRHFGGFQIYVNGTSLLNIISDTDMEYSKPITIGGAAHTTGQYFNGYIDDLRITKGVARYTANFTPPTQPFPNW